MTDSPTEAQTTDTHELDPTEWDAVVAEADRHLAERLATEPELGGAGDAAPMGLTPRYFNYDDSPVKSSTLLRRQLWVVHTAECPLRVGYAQSLTAWGTRDYQPRSSWHKFVDPATVARWISTSRAAWHAAGANDRSTGYEQAGYASFTRDRWLMPDGVAQMDLLAQEIVKDSLPVSGVRWLSDTQVSAILAGRDRTMTGMCTHEQVSRLSGRTSRTDPGRGYPRDVLLSFVDHYHPGTPSAPKPAPTDDLPRGWFLTEDGVNDLPTRAAIQRLVGADDDGSWGYGTRTQIQRWINTALKRRGSTRKPLAVDGSLGRLTALALQEVVGAPLTGTWNWGWEIKPDPTTRYLEAYHNRVVRNTRQPV